ncbi:tRNA pseudouridine synthase-like protein [Hyaloscypha hepaticicola]|uniref:tRNA pseudouridine synthase 1 n=1 Tax=Hyaloscypha hepaticicola TaxID=2082293 RepID=A0A2J6Q430_9HELO|nr:tRNA pseudouridine synthase-like protein [Hyaloscypha hepaticicola]
MADAPPPTPASNQDGAASAVGHNARSQRGDRNRGGRGGRGRGRGGQSKGRGRGFGSKDSGERHKKRDMGRGEWKRARNDEEQATKRRKTEDGGEVATYSTPFTKEEIEAETRKPKRKVAVMIGYAGSGYKGMQINAQEKTIEGDLFKAFVAAGAISKNNSDDPKKTSLVRCARTDKGVHAAGNVISLKLIVEEPDIVQTINEHLPPQIRVWGIERTNGSFSCYTTCDSRWYEYLIPTYSFLPPHPQSFLGKKLVESAEDEGVFETYQSHQEDVASFWKDAEDAYVKPILDKLDPEMRDAVIATIHSSEEETDDQKKLTKKQIKEDRKSKLEAMDGVAEPDVVALEEEKPELESVSILTPLEKAIKEVKAAYVNAKKAYRISPFRRQRVQEALDCYVGTRNFHNYTIQKTFSDPSAKRVIRSFKVGPDPIIINDTEWLSLKVHGQSFMMHQIRKMVAMAALIVRCGTSKDLIIDSYGPANISIPKAPGLGLLLERPVFDSYNERAVREFSREKLDFDKYKKEMDEFKQREIYDRIFREEEKDHQFHAFFHHIDHFRTDYFLWVTAKGISAAKQSKAPARTDDLSDDEVDVNGEEG